MTALPWRHVWITGASTGIGAALARELARNGALVSISARSRDALDAVASANDNIAAYPLDVTLPDDVAATISAIEAARGPIDLAILNAGVWSVSDATDLKFDAFRTGTEVNFLGVAAAIAPLSQAMIARGRGHLAVIASVAGYRGLPRAAYYGPTKAALINLCEGLAPEFKRHGIKLQVINPGFVRTPMTDKNDFPMPFIVEPAVAVRHIVRGLRGNRFEIAFPWQLVLALKTLAMLPAGIYLKLVERAIMRDSDRA